MGISLQNFMKKSKERRLQSRKAREFIKKRGKKMKRILTIICCLTLLLGIVPFCVSASETASQNMQTVEYLEDGSYIVTELEVTPAVARTARSYTKKSTYYTASNTAVFAVSLTGNFNYTYNVSCTATSQSVSVSIYDNSASYVTKTSSRSGATVYGSGTVYYLGKNRTLSLRDMRMLKKKGGCFQLKAAAFNMGFE